MDEVDDSEDVRRGIKRTGLASRDCLIAGAPADQFVQLLADEWEDRKKCAEGVTTPEVEKAIAAAADAGALVSKLCGAGGGGCMISDVEPENKDAVLQALEANGATHMEYKISPEGLVIEKK